MNLIVMKKIAICGSMFFHKEMTELKSSLEAIGYSVFAPRSFEEMGIIDYDKYTQEEGKALKVKYDLIRDYYSKIVESEAVLIANYEKRGVAGYIGGNTLLEIGFAYVNNKDIFMVNSAPDLQYKAEIEAMHPIVIGSDLGKIKEHYAKLPKAFLSSQSPLKIDAVSFGFRKAGYKYDVQGYKTKSTVSEQPMSIEEACDGAGSRMKNLKKQIRNSDYEYLVSIESGLAKLHPKHEYFGFSVCIIEDGNGNEKINIATALEIPKEMTDILDRYPDLGVFVQEKYNSEFKDPYQFLTHGKVKRLDLLTASVMNTVSQF